LLLFAEQIVEALFQFRAIRRLRALRRNLILFLDSMPRFAIPVLMVTVTIQVALQMRKRYQPSMQNVRKTSVKKVFGNKLIWLVKAQQVFLD